MDRKRRIINAAKYFQAMKPSDLTVGGIVHPKYWRQLMLLMELILEDEDEQLEIQTTD